MERLRLLEKMCTFKLGLTVLLVIGLLIFPKMVPAQEGFYVGGYSDQGQWMMNNGAVIGTLWQDQIQMQQTVLGIENMPIAEVNSYMSGYMEQQINDYCSSAYTSTGNSTYYWINVSDSTSTGVNADASAYVFTRGDAFGSANAWSDIVITLP